MPEETTTYPTDETLDSTVTKAHTFIKKAAQREFFVILQRVGFSLSVLQKGLDLYEAAAGIKADLPALAAKEPADESTKARDFLDAWDDTHFPILKAFFQSNNPSLGEHLFRGGLKAEKGLNAVLGIKTLVTRITKVRDGKDTDREKTKDADVNTLKALSDMGYGDALWNDLITKVEQVRGLESLPETPPEANNEDAIEAQERRDKYALYTWYWLWATVVSNRVDSIPNKYARRLGVNRPGRPRAKKDPTPTPPTQEDKKP